MPKKVSRHGTLDETDTSDAVAIKVNQVLEHCDTPNTSHVFGAAGALPPKTAQKIEARYMPYHVFRDEKQGTDWIGLNLLSNNEKGVLQPVVLSPGEYKIELKLSKNLNKNFAVDSMGTVVGGIGSLVDSENREEVRSRGMPNSYIDISLNVQAKRYAITSTSGIVDLGVHREFVRTFTVKEQDGMSTMNLTLKSHSVFKRLKVEGVLYRRDFTPEEPEGKVQRRRAQAGKEILRKALSSGQTRLNKGVDMQTVVRAFYSAVAPDRLKNLDVVFKHFEGRDDDLINTLEAKYHYVILPDGTFHPK